MARRLVLHDERYCALASQLRTSTLLGIEVVEARLATEQFARAGDLQSL